MIQLSVLDQSPIGEGRTAAEALKETIELARLADRLGYRRYWLAEHHAHPGFAGPAPEVLIGTVAAATRRIRVGSGGVMLSHYSALKVAECFRVLEALHPGRIDLGIGRAPGSDQLTAVALAGGAGEMAGARFPQQVADVIGYLSDSIPAGHPFAQLRVMPAGSTMPEVWLLGSSDQSAILAAHFGTPFSFAHFINDVGGPEVMQAYRQGFRPSPRLARPLANIGVFVICADTEEKAMRAAASRDLWRLRVEQGRAGPVPPVEEALAYPYSEAEMRRVERNRHRQVVGAPDQVKARLEALATEFGVDEIAVVTVCHSFADRCRSYELLAQALALEARE